MTSTAPNYPFVPLRFWGNTNIIWSFAHGAYLTFSLELHPRFSSLEIKCEDVVHNVSRNRTTDPTYWAFIPYLRDTDPRCLPLAP